MKVLIFDVETTGLLPKIINFKDVDKYPYVIQLSYLLFDVNKYQIIDKFNDYIILNRKIKISNKITKLTGINKEKSLSGVTIQTGLKRITEAIKEADCIVAHNLEFDARMLLVELERNREILKKVEPEVLDLKDIIKEKDYYCTMMNGIEICNIMVKSLDGGREYKKWPKLIELYKHLFEEKEVDNLHNSLVDAMVCLRCYLKMREDHYMEEEEFNNIIKKLI